ncbi:hypothetical protein HW130_31165 [Streptomyces sp. PKU-EA00015]|uniref:hypothetical protein n=1 Tax=Streptomyces sp. PKU-EA00015 TaxID=2748326 RepID=UPI0015A11D77|nr:hypothetical protein [Streptomyces sp. PKU-EA00015]NWF30661.1 hypothetical protein [Streptomyces sp. PKU-EA00015]
MAVPTSPENRPVDLTGDACITFTAPFYAEGNPLEPKEACTLPSGDDLDGAGFLLRRPVSLSPLLQGSLTYGQPTVDLLTTFVGSDEWKGELQRRLKDLLAARAGQSLLDTVDVTGMVFPDGYGSIAVTLHLPGGWEPRHRESTLAGLGREGREPLAAELRSMLLPPAQRLLRRCGAGETVAIPYFNLTYAGSTDHPEPGRSRLADGMRTLIYPDSPMPLASHSPWRDEFLFAGYAYNLLATPDPKAAAEKFTLLLLILDVSYIRLARTATAADDVLRNPRHSADTRWLSQLEHRLRSEYQALVTPTFSYDHHALRTRDAVLRAWEAGNLQSRAADLLSTVRQTVDLRLAEDQARRIRRVNLVVAVLTVLSGVATAQAAVSLYDRFFG